MSRLSGVVRGRASTWLVLPFVVVLGAGCRAEDKAKASAVDSVSGVVRLGDRSLQYGVVAFHGKSGRVMKSVIQTDGSYSIRNPEMGETRVVVIAGDPPVGAGSPGGGPPPPKLERFAVPAKYADPEKTDKTYTITPGQHVLDIVLEP